MNFYDSQTHIPKHLSEFIVHKQPSKPLGNQLEVTMGHQKAWNTPRPSELSEDKSNESIKTVNKRKIKRKLKGIYMETHFRRLKPVKKETFYQKMKTKNFKKKSKTIKIEDLKMMSKKFIKFDEEGLGDFKKKTFMDPKGNILDETRGERDLKCFIQLANSMSATNSSNPTSMREEFDSYDTNIFNKKSTKKHIPVIYEESSFEQSNENNKILFPQNSLQDKTKENVFCQDKVRLNKESIPMGELLIPSEELGHMNQDQESSNLNALSAIKFKKKLESIQNGSQNINEQFIDIKQIDQDLDEEEFRKTQEIDHMKKQSLQMSKNGKLETTKNLKSSDFEKRKLYFENESLMKESDIILTQNFPINRKYEVNSFQMNSDELIQVLHTDHNSIPNQNYMMESDYQQRKLSDQKVFYELMGRSEPPLTNFAKPHFEGRNLDSGHEHRIVISELEISKDNKLIKAKDSLKL
jgi:hypothetical protein